MPTELETTQRELMQLRDEYTRTHDPITLARWATVNREVKRLQQQQAKQQQQASNTSTPEGMRKRVRELDAILADADRLLAEHMRDKTGNPCLDASRLHPTNKEAIAALACRFAAKRREREDLVSRLQRGAT